MEILNDKSRHKWAVFVAWLLRKVLRRKPNTPNSFNTGDRINPPAQHRPEWESEDTRGEANG